MNKFLKLLYQPYKWLVVVPVAFVSTMGIGMICFFVSLIFGQDAADIPAVIWARICCAVVPIKVNLKGKERYSRTSAYVVVANHQSIADIPVIHSAIGLKIKWIMKKELDHIPLFSVSCHKLGCIFIDRSDRQAAIDSIHKAKATLSPNSSVFFFAEGTRSKDGKLRPFKKGAFIFAMETGIPLLPVTIKNSYRVLPSDTLDLVPGIVDVEVHAPVHIGESDKKHLDKIVEQVRTTIASGL